MPPHGPSVPLLTAISDETNQAHPKELWVSKFRQQEPGRWCWCRMPPLPVLLHPISASFVLAFKTCLISDFAAFQRRYLPANCFKKLRIEDVVTDFRNG